MKYSTIAVNYAPLLTQLPADPVTPSILKILVDAGVAVTLTIAILVLAYAILQQNRNKGKDEESDNKRLSTVLENMNNLTNAIIGDRDHNLKLLEASSETQRLITVATNENTGQVRQMNTTMDGMRFDLQSYTSLHSDSVEQLTGSISRFESQMVAFGGKLDTAIENINHNAGDHTEITRLVTQAIEQLLNTKLELLTAIKGVTPTPAPAPIEANITFHTAVDKPPDLEATA
jgi:hypothetical protein